MIIRTHTWWISVSGDVSELADVKQAFQRPHPNEREIRKRLTRDKSDLWDGLVKFWREGKTNGTILIRKGFSERLRECLDTTGQSYTWDEGQGDVSEIAYDPTLIDGITLDDVQCDALRGMVANKRCSIELKTGSGKTEIYLCAIAAFLMKFPDRQVLVIVPKRALLRDAYERALKRLPQYAGIIGMLGDGKCDLKQVVFSTAASARENEKLTNSEKILAWRSSVSLLVLDEAHHTQAKGWREIVNNCTPDYVWGVSGKVTYFDDLKTMELEEIFGKPVYVGGSTVRRVPVTAIFYRVEGWDGLFENEGLYPSLIDGCPVMYRVDGKGWVEGVWRGPDDRGKMPNDLQGQRAGIFNQDTRLEPQPASENVIYWRPYDVGVMEFEQTYRWAAKLAQQFTLMHEPWVIAVRRIRQLKLMCKHLTCRHRYVDGSLNGVSQILEYEKLNSGEVDGLVCQSSVISEGVNIPNLVHFIKLDGITSEQALEQQKGRVERAVDGKERGFIHVPIFSQHPSLLAASVRVSDYYSRSGLDIEVAKYTLT